MSIVDLLCTPDVYGPYLFMAAYVNKTMKIFILKLVISSNLSFTSNGVGK